MDDPRSLETTDLDPAIAREIEKVKQRYIDYQELSLNWQKEDRQRLKIIIEASNDILEALDGRGINVPGRSKRRSCAENAITRYGLSYRARQDLLIATRLEGRELLDFEKQIILTIGTLFSAASIASSKAKSGRPLHYRKYKLIRDLTIFYDKTKGKPATKATRDLIALLREHVAGLPGFAASKGGQPTDSHLARLWRDSRKVNADGYYLHW